MTVLFCQNKLNEKTTAAGFATSRNELVVGTHSVGLSFSSKIGTIFGGSTGVIITSKPWFYIYHSNK